MSADIFVLVNIMVGRAEAEFAHVVHIWRFCGCLVKGVHMAPRASRKKEKNSSHQKSSLL